MKINIVVSCIELLRDYPDKSILLFIRGLTIRNMCIRDRESFTTQFNTTGNRNISMCLDICYLIDRKVFPFSGWRSPMWFDLPSH